MTVDNQLTAGTEPQTSTAVSLAKPQKKRDWRFLAWLGLGLGSGGMLFLCHFPMAWSWLAWVGLVPFLCLIRAEGRGAWIYLAALAGGLAYFVPALHWMRVADPLMGIAWFLLGLYCSLYFLAALFILRFLDRTTVFPLIVTVPAVWTALEFFRASFLTGFSWYFLGHTQHDFLTLIQVADLGGVFLITFLVAAVNAWIVTLLFLRPEVECFFRGPVVSGSRQNGDFGRSVFHLPENFFGLYRAGTLVSVQGGIVAFLFGAALFYGKVRLEKADFTEGPRVALLQSSLDQRFRMAASSDIHKQMSSSAYYQRLCVLAWDKRHHPTMVIWPETSFPYTWFEITKDLNLLDARIRLLAQNSQRELSGLAKAMKTHHLVGLNVHLDDGPVQYNSALLCDTQGYTVGRYDKLHPLPFGEYLPFEDTLPFMKIFTPYKERYSVTPGERFTRLKLGDWVYEDGQIKKKDWHFGVLICYEDSDPFLARRYGRQDGDGPPVDFLVNISNDGWFDGTSEHEEHLALARFRAIECRRALVRSVNMGISAVIDANGRVYHPRLKDVMVVLKKLVTDEFGKKEPGMLRAKNYRYEGDFLIVENFPDPIPKVDVDYILHNWSASPQADSLPLNQWGSYKKVAGVFSAVIPIDRRISLYAFWGDWLPWSCWVFVVTVMIWKGWFARRASSAAK